MPLVDHILSVVAPHNCVLCGTEGGLLCKWCAPDAFLPLPSRCYRCKALTSDSATCKKCLKPTTPNHVWVVTSYESTAMALVHRYKFDRVRAAASTIGDAMSRALPYLPPGTLVIPVPTATARIRQRGYDHAQLLARHIARQNHRAFTNGLARLTQSRQVGANRKQRISQLKDAFIASKPNGIKNAHVLVVDDVITTGATIEAVTIVLKRAGAKTVDVIIFASKEIN